MTTLDWERIEGIVREALAKPEGERSVHISLELGGEPELLAHARRIIRMSSRPQSDEEIAEEQSGWRLVLPLGMDGLGIDYLAEKLDRSTDRMALLKVSRVTLAEAQAQQQFTQDLRTLALLFDSGVARMLDSGWVGQGRPYVVVEFDAGVRITDAARELPLEGKVLVFRKVLAAVQYAHLKQVLHGDLRPENILVVNEEPRLYDFGLTRLLTTGTDSIAAQEVIDVESIAYNSPEQIRGLPLTEQSDVYSLGVIFYEMLLGRRPYGRSGDDVMQMGRAICEQLPARIESVNEDLNYIVQKALEKNLAGRYQSVAEFSADVQAYLDGRPVAPRKESIPDVALRLLRQNWITVSLVLAVFAVGGTALFYKGRADAKADKIQAITSALFSGKGSKGAEDANSVQSAKKYLDEMLEANAGKPEVMEELSKAYLQLAEVELKGNGIIRGNRGAAIQSARKAYELSLQLMKDKDPLTEKQLIEYAKSAKMLTEMLSDAKDYKEALKIAMEWKERLSKIDSKDPEFQKALAAANQATADLLYLSGEKTEAMPVARTAMGQFQSIFESDPKNEQKGRDYAQSASNVGGKALELRLFPEALSSFNIAAAILRPQAEKKESQVGPMIDLAKTLNGLGETLVKTKQGKEARASFLEARQILEQAAKKERGNEEVRQTLADNYMRTARMGREMSDFASAIGESERAIEILQKLVDQPGSRPEFRRDLAMALTVKGEILAAQGRKANAQELFSQAVRLWQLYSNLGVMKPDEEAEYNRVKSLV